jgi:hypothetical protein
MMKTNIIFKSFAILLFSACLTMGMQKWIGDVTIYSPDLELKRETMHKAILHNTIPEGYASWNAVGAGGTNIRIAVVYLADLIHQHLAIGILKTYKILDSLFLFLSIPLLFLYLRLFTSDQFAITGTLFFCIILPITYFFQAFHPWDRLSLFFWIILLILIERRHFIGFAMILAISIFVKYDTLFLPILYFLRHYKHQTMETFAKCLALFLVVCLELYELINSRTIQGTEIIVPGLNMPHFPGFLEMLAKNINVAFQQIYSYPPLLTFTLPFLLAGFGWKNATNGIRWYLLFSLFLLGVFITKTNFIEVRAELPALILVLPMAILGYQRLLEEKPGILGR